LAYKADADVVHHILRKAGIVSIAHIDMREPPVVADIQIHVRIPVYATVSWAHTNILLTHPDQWVNEFVPYIHAFRIYSMVENPWIASLHDEIPKKLYDTFFPLLQVTKEKPLGTPILQIADCPMISIITPTYHRKKLIDIAFHNLLSTDYPKEKIEWIIVEDTGDFPKENMATEKIVNFQVLAPTISVKYIPLEGRVSIGEKPAPAGARVSIGEKRNIGIAHATHPIILFMDDDDHCPITAFRRRVAWLLHGGKDIVCCTTLPLYDLSSGASAVSVPPFHLPLSQRISEATLTFKKYVWEDRQFPTVSIAEGEDWLKRRESQVREIPPQQIIVAFSHGANQSSRIVPKDAKQSCFWGFPVEYLECIHGL
jgi:hypothetical protein